MPVLIYRTHGAKRLVNFKQFLSVPVQKLRSFVCSACKVTLSDNEVGMTVL